MKKFNYLFSRSSLAVISSAQQHQPFPFCYKLVTRDHASFRYPSAKPCLRPLTETSPRHHELSRSIIPSDTEGELKEDLEYWGNDTADHH
jgi:hypothetical protein